MLFLTGATGTVGLPLLRRVDAVPLRSGPTAFATCDEGELLEVPLIARQGTAHAERLGVLPKPMWAVLGLG